MTPREVRELSAPEYLAFLNLMDRERRELNRQARAKTKGKGRKR